VVTVEVLIEGDIKEVREEGMDEDEEDDMLVVEE
jgi:hypothetical protein